MEDRADEFEPFSMAGVEIATIAGIDPEGWALVSAPDGSLVRARSIVPVTREMAGRDAAVMAIQGDPQGLLILGVIQSPIPLSVRERHVIEAGNELVLRCGRSSLTLRADGHVTLRGKHLLTRADGHNRVQGATVQLN